MRNHGLRALAVFAFVALAAGCSSGSDEAAPTTTKARTTTTSAAGATSTTSARGGGATTTTTTAKAQPDATYCAFAKAYQGQTVASTLAGTNTMAIGLVISSLTDRLPADITPSVKTDLADAKVALTAADLDTAKAKIRSALDGSAAYCGVAAGGATATDRNGKPLVGEGAGQIPSKYPTSLDPPSGDTIIGSQQSDDTGKTFVVLDVLTDRDVTNLVADLKMQLVAGNFNVSMAEAYTGGPGPDGGKVQAIGNGWRVDINVSSQLAISKGRRAEYRVQLNQA